MEKLCLGLCSSFANVRYVPVDYSAKARAAVEHYFQCGPIPLRDCRGGPSFVYYFGIYSAKNAIVFHIDSDMMLAPGMEAWLPIAIEQLSKPGVFCVSPLPGPPTANGELRQFPEGQTLMDVDKCGRRYVWDGFSTRIFLIDRRSLRGFRARQVVGPLRFARAIVRRNWPFRLPEEVIAKHMALNRWQRVEIGGPRHFYSLHPPYKSERFVRSVAAILQKILHDDVPELQSGCFDINGGLFDFSREIADIRRNSLLRRMRNIPILRKYIRDIE